MLQFYFLSIIANAAAGLVLSSDYLSRRFGSFRKLAERLASRRSRLVCGIAALLVGLCTLFWPVAPGIPVVGDLLPSIVGMAMGVALAFDVLRQEALFPRETSERSAPQGLDWRSLLGLIGMVIAVLHFFLPERPFV